MRSMWRGLVAGAAGTTALNAVTYLDMAARGRPASAAPQQLVEKAAAAAGVRIPGGEQERDNRLNGLGPLSGILVGITVGAATGLLQLLLQQHGRRLPTAVGIALTTAAAMAGSDIPLAASGLSSPSTWSKTDWISDILPHLAYGLTTTACLTPR